ncbi:hypothetical protein B0H12DRAFT_1141431 [Mycena haematopus]|nr:hypothetical protein B0H12DRAFT_1141431 [Mycena haematopus]
MGSYLSLTDHLPGSLAVLLLQLRTGPLPFQTPPAADKLTSPRTHQATGHTKLIPHLFHHLGRTGRFHSVHGTLPGPDPSQASRHNSTG